MINIYSNNVIRDLQTGWGHSYLQDAILKQLLIFILQYSAILTDLNILIKGPHLFFYRKQDHVKSILPEKCSHVPKHKQTSRVKIL